ncbi:MAG: hypothetical protein AAF203_10205, partial [Pseudomonadota bacterium]
MLNFFCSWATGFAILTTSHLSWADTFRLNLNQDFSKKESVDRDLFGLNLLYTVTDEERASMVSSLKGKINFVRWPGGTLVNAYHYRRPHYRAHANSRDGYDPRLDGDAEDFTDFNELLAFTKSLGAKPMIGIPLQSGYKKVGNRAVWDPQFENEIRDIAINFASKVEYAYIDNETGIQHGLFANKFDRAMSSEEYAYAYNRIRPILLSKNPKLKILAN